MMKPRNAKLHAVDLKMKAFVREFKGIVAQAENCNKYAKAKGGSMGLPNVLENCAKKVDAIAKIVNDILSEANFDDIPQ